MTAPVATAATAARRSRLRSPGESTPTTIPSVPMTASLPQPVQDVFAKFITTEYTTIDAAGRPIAWPVTPYYERGGPCIDITTGLGYPKKANDARENPKVALLFSDPTGSN